MGKRQSRNASKIGAMFLSILFLLSGCAAPPKPQPKKIAKPLRDVYLFRSLDEVDLDNDGKKEIVAIYTVGLSSSGVKVIKFRDDKGEVVFEHVFDTPDVKLIMKGKVPALVVERTVKATGCSSGRSRILYRWDGKAFTNIRK